MRKRPASLDLSMPERWEVSGVRAPTAFFSWLSETLKPGSEMYIEGDGMAEDVKGLLSQSAVVPQMYVSPGAVFPQSPHFTVATSAALLEQLSELSRNLAEPEICSHLVIYRDGTAVVVWYDAFDAPLWVSRSLGGTAIRRLCEITGGSVESD